jgi:hypothetical protein
MSSLINKIYSTGGNIDDVNKYVVSASGTTGNVTASYALNGIYAVTASYVQNLNNFNYVFIKENTTVYSASKNDYVVVDMSGSISTMNIRLPDNPTDKSSVGISWPIWNDDSNQLKIFSSDKQIKFGTGSLSSAVDFSILPDYPSVGLFCFDATENIWKGGLNVLGTANNNIPGYTPPQPPAPVTVNYWGNGSDGDLYVVTESLILDSTSGGDMIVKNYNNIYIDTGRTLDLYARKGAIIYCQGDCYISGTLSVQSRYSCDPVVEGVPSTGIRMVRFVDGGTDTLSSSDFIGCGTTAITSETNQSGINGNGKIYIVTRTGGSGGSARSNGESPWGTTGNNPGSSIINGTGGGDSGQSRGDQGNGGSPGIATSGAGAEGTCFSGGSGGGGCFASNDSTTVNAGGGGNKTAGGGSSNGGSGGNGVTGFWGAGGGAGNPGGSPGPGAGGTGGFGEYRCGGLLFLLVKGNLYVTGSGSSLDSRNGNAGSGQYTSGGSSGGGRLVVLYGNSATTGSSTIDVGNGSLTFEQILI